MAWITHRPIGLVHRAPGSLEGYTLFCSVVGHHATIVDHAGQVVHQWQHDEGIQHVKLLSNGHLLMQTAPAKEAGGREKFGGSAGAMIELDRHGSTVWENRDVSQHHDYIRLENGHTVYLAWERIPADISKQVRGGQPDEEDPEEMWGDVIREIDRDGNIVKEWNSWEHLRFDEDVICPLEGRKEWTHANSLDVLPNGDWLISFRLIDTIAIVSSTSGEITWKWGTGKLSHQHNAQMLTNGNIMVFDNGCHRRRGPNFSRVLELDPDSEEFAWTYTAETILAFYSFMVSGAERLANGNTLITEGASGRLFEVTAEKEVVWEYVSPWTIKSGFGPTPAVFRSFRLAPDDPRLGDYSLQASDYSDLNDSIARGEVQREPEYQDEETVVTTAAENLKDN